MWHHVVSCGMRKWLVYCAGGFVRARDGRSGPLYTAFPVSTRIDPMLVKLWPTACDAGPALNQLRFNGSYLQPCLMQQAFPGLFFYWQLLIVDLPSFNGSRYPRNTKNSSDAVLMLGQRLRRSPSIETALVECLLFTGTSTIEQFTAWCNRQNK